ncbi:hypothetical protein AB835_11060 [Candidatus Endobugula sertula]|uniref:Uncharacterized protein n=1 Tax=Candidatus Endobugula sertula TaxID=62101 RepID=A0A1D2QN75_9GAMM|nr:hypothetical protein AB835_11060 [Candidatus Endobugula sertula]
MSVFPENFLPQEIHVFVYRCIIDAYQQLTKLDPTNKQHVESLKIHSSQLETIIRTSGTKKNIRLQSAAQINELRQYMNLLGRFLQKSVQKKHITQKQYGHYRLLIKGLTTQLAIDGYIISARQSLDIGKNRLSIHYYDLAKKLLTKETPSNYKEQIQYINEELSPLMDAEMLKQEQEQHHKESVVEEGEATPLIESNENKEWAQFEEEAGWKKKNIYD